MKMTNLAKCNKVDKRSWICSMKQICSKVCSNLLQTNSLNRCMFLQHPPLPHYNSPALQKLQVICSHYYLTILGNALALANVICICVSDT